MSAEPSPSTPAFFAPGGRIAVLLPLPLAGAYDYRVGDQALAAGDFVAVPLGQRHVTGVVWGAGAGDVPESRLRPVGRRLEAPPLPAVARAFIDWVAAYSMAPAGAVLKMAMSVPAALDPAPGLVAVRLADVLKLAQASNLGSYVYFDSADGYYESWDIASAMHPQTLLATHMNGEPLPAQNGAPLRLATPIKLGYKLSKWVTAIRVEPTLMASRKGYWEDQGYEWFAGL